MEEYDLLIVADATRSMQAYFTSLHTSLPQVISISALTGCFSRIGIIAYRDYTDFDNSLQWSGWLHQDPESDGEGKPDLVSFAKNIRAQGGADYPEAAKTALAKAYSVMRPEAKTLMLLYTDATPHAPGKTPEPLTNAAAEHQALSEPTSYDGFGPLFADWVSAAKTLATGEKQAKVLALLAPEMQPHCSAYYNFLCTMTGGACIHLHDSTPDTISKTTVEVLLAWMQLAKAMAGNANQEVPADLSHYVNIDDIHDLEKETGEKTSKYFPVPYTRHTPSERNITRVALSTDAIKQLLPRKPTAALNPIRRWTTDTSYKDNASRHLMRIIKEDIRAIAINPVFGGLWRAVCRDREYPGRYDLVNAFSQAVEAIKDQQRKDEMTRWLNESYNFSADIVAIIESVPARDQLPCVLFDPTLNFAQTDATEDEVGKLKAATDLLRSDLLEITRSCDPRVLRCLGHILTRLTYVNDVHDMPEHIARSTKEQVRRIPLALATDKYNRQFWKVLLHTIIPGTLLSPRGAAVLSALTIRLGIVPLADAAEQEMINFKDNWNNLEDPETWALSCLNLLLDANKAYRKKQEASKTSPDADSEPQKPSSLLNESDALLFHQLVAFKRLEHNLDTPLTARIPWTPKKSACMIGPLVICHKCKYARSVTIMGADGQCGPCISADNGTPMDLKIGVSPEVTPESDATWVECNAPSCRAQYIVYDVQALKVRPKCYYCRYQDTPHTVGKKARAPVVECTRCLNRMIWPERYRPSSFDASRFVCPPCMSGCQTTIEIETTARELTVENTMSWLVHDSERPGTSPFINQSSFRTISAFGTDGFMRRITLFPKHNTFLTRRGKPISNTDELLATVKDLVAGRKAAKVYCSLCFSSFWPSALNPACGRRGCLQRICTSCLAVWYGSNASGRIINTAALACPFCRRLPAPRPLGKYANGVHAVKGLTRAIENKGTWIYAWCSECFTAKEFVERDCARGIPPQLMNWKCESCVEEIQRRSESEEADRIKKIKPCPKCGTMTEKVSGCGHITCPVDSCGSSWCYFCGRDFPEDEIYDHMGEVHGGIYGDDGEDDYDDEETG